MIEDALAFLQSMYRNNRAFQTTPQGSIAMSFFLLYIFVIVDSPIIMRGMWTISAKLMLNQRNNHSKKRYLTWLRRVAKLQTKSLSADHVYNERFGTHAANPT